MAYRAVNGKKFESLFRYGHTSPYGGDESRADFALVALLAFWCRDDPVRIDSLFRESALMRPKWNERHSGDGRTYGQLTIDKVLASPHEVYSAKARVSSDGASSSGAPSADAEPEPETDAPPNGSDTPEEPGAQKQQAAEETPERHPYVEQDGGIVRQKIATQEMGR